MARVLQVQLHLFLLVTLTVITPAIAQVRAKATATATNELRPIPGQSAAYSAGYSQGYLGLPLKGYHSKQFLLGYINGTQEILNDKAEVAGYLGKKAFVNNESLEYYYSGKWFRAQVKCGDQYPLGAFPNQTNDNYRQFWIGYSDGTQNRDASDPGEDPSNTPNCPSSSSSTLGRSAEYCQGWKFGWYNDDAALNNADDRCPSDKKAFGDLLKVEQNLGIIQNASATQQAVEGNNTLPIIHVPALPSLDDMEAPAGHGPIWNFVNESKSSKGNMSMTGQKTSGTIIFTWEPIGGNWYHQGKHKFFSGSISEVFIEHINGKNKILKGLWGYDYLNTGLYLCKANGEFTKDSPCFLKFTKIEPNHSELVDKRGDIIHLMRDNGSGGRDNSTSASTGSVMNTTMSPNEHLTPDTNKSVTYNEGFSQGYIQFPLKGYHTLEFLTAYRNGTELYWFNRGEAEGYYNIHPTVSEKKNSDHMRGWN